MGHCHKLIWVHEGIGLFEVVNLSLYELELDSVIFNNIKEIDGGDFKENEVGLRIR